MSEVADKLYRAIGVAADMAAIDARADGGNTAAKVTEAAVKAFLDCAIGNGVIKILSEDEWPLYFVTSPPYTRELKL